jgi:hypothetical protein
MPETINYHQYRLGNDHGEIRFGHVHDDENIAGVLLRTGADGGRHYIQMDSSGDVNQGRKGCTMNVCPGSYSVMAGADVAKETPAIYQIAENGDIIIGAPRGRIRIFAQNIEIIAQGPDGENGVVQIDGSEKVLITAPTINIDSKVSTKIASEKTVDIVGNAVLNIYGGLIEGIDGASSSLTGKGSKTCPIPTLATEAEIVRKILSVIDTINGVVG